MDYRNKNILAPMVRIGTLPTRLLALRYGADIVYTEEIIDFKMLKTKRIVNEMLGTIDYVADDGTIVFRTCEEERDKVVFQIGTSDAKRALKVAQMLENDIAALDVNMGCPKTFSLSGGMGAALLTQPDKIKSILTTLVENVKIPVTCKIRCFQNIEETIKLCHMIETTGITAIGVHGRTKDERPRHACRYEYIKQISQSLRIPVIANGGSSDISEYSDLDKFRLRSGTDSIMIARAAEHNVSIFRKEGMIDKFDLIKEYCKVAIDVDNHWTNTKFNIQAILGSDVQYEDGERLLASKCNTDIYVIYGMMDYYNQVSSKHSQYLLEAKRKREEGLHKYNGLAAKIITDPQSGEITEYISDHQFDRKYTVGNDTPKMFLIDYLKHERIFPLPEFTSRQDESRKKFSATLIFNGVNYTTTAWHNRRVWAEHAACEIYMAIANIRDTAAYREQQQTNNINQTNDKRGSTTNGETESPDNKKTRSTSQTNSELNSQTEITIQT